MRRSLPCTQHGECCSSMPAHAHAHTECLRLRAQRPLLCMRARACRCTELRQSRLDARLPLHLSMTQSTCSKFEPLRQRFMRTLSQQPGATQQQAAGEAPWAAVQQVPEQLAIVTVQGAVLAHAHVQAASSYLPAAERQDALKLLAGVLGARPERPTACSMQCAAGAM